MGDLLMTLRVGWDVSASSSPHGRPIVGSTAWSLDSRLMISAGYDGKLLLWDATGTLLKTLEGHTDLVLSAAWSPDGQTIASTVCRHDPSAVGLDSDSAPYSGRPHRLGQ